MCADHYWVTDFQPLFCPSEVQLASSNMASQEEYDRMASTQEKRGCIGSIQRSTHPSILSQRIITLRLTEHITKEMHIETF